MCYSKLSLLNTSMRLFNNSKNRVNNAEITTENAVIRCNSYLKMIKKYCHNNTAVNNLTFPAKII